MDVAILYAGCGWMVPFEFGSGCWFEKHFDTASPFLTYGGVSAGSAVCVALALGLDMEACCEEAVKQLYVPCKNWPFPMCEGIKKVCQAGDEPLLFPPPQKMSCFSRCLCVQVMETVSPVADGCDDVWRALSGRVTLGLSILDCSGGCIMLPSFKPELVSTFRDRNHGIAVVRASAHIMFIGGIRGYKIPGQPHGARYYDGAYSQLVPLTPKVARSHQIRIDGLPLGDGDVDILPNLGYTVSDLVYPIQLHRGMPSARIV